MQNEFFNYGKKNNMQLTILTILKCIIQSI